MLTEAQEREVARIDAGESLWDESTPIEEPLQFKQPLGMVVSMRLTAAQWQTLYAEARELGVGPTTLARMWVLERLRTLQRDQLAESQSARTTGRVSTPPRRQRAAEPERGEVGESAVPKAVERRLE